MTPLDPVVQKHLRKVYTSLSMAMATSALSAFLQLYFRLPALSLVTGIATICTALYFVTLPEHSPRRTSVFFAFAFLEGWTLGPLLDYAAMLDPFLPFVAFAATASIFACFSVASIFARRRSYLYLGGILSASLSALLCVAIANIFVQSAAAYTFQLYAGLLVFSGFVCYDSQKIIEKAHAGERDHLKHSFELFLDFVALFRRILIILARNAGEKRKNEDNRRRRRNE